MRIRRISPSRYLWIAGVLLVLTSAAITLSKRVFAGPGRLIARESSLTWKGPEGIAQPTIATLKFELENPGRFPVRVLSVATGCGCLRADVNPKIIPPLGRAVVEVAAHYFPTGESFVPIELDTDSSAIPKVSLQVHLIGGRKPPYLMKAGGDLSYMGDFDPKETREIEAYTVLGAKQADRSPLINDIPPFLKIDSSQARETPYALPGTVLKTRTFTVRFTSEPPPGLNTGEIVFRDPWSKSEVARVPWMTDFSPPARVSPPLVVLNASDPSGRTQRILIAALKPMKDVQVSFEPRGQTDLILSPLKSTGDDSRAEFEVSLRPEVIESASNTPHIVITWRPDHRLVVPVVVKGGSGR